MAYPNSKILPENALNQKQGLKSGFASWEQIAKALPSRQNLIYNHINVSLIMPLNDSAGSCLM